MELICVWALLTMSGNTPHFISIDETNGFWFVTLMDAGYIEQYCLKEDTLIDRIEIGDLPSLSTIDIQNKNIYISRMNMPGMPSMRFCNKRHK